jgi:CRP/FNR family transcriptional regulator, cyclic AMP receptor protein
LEQGEKTKLLSVVDLLDSLSREEIGQLGRRMPEMHLERGQILYTPAYQSRTLFLLLRGRVRVYKVAEGREITLSVVGAGEMFGEAALTNKRRQGAYAQAMQSSEIALMSHDTLCRLVRDKPEVGLRAIELLSERLSFCEDRMADIGLKEIPARLAGLILHLVQSEGVVTAEGYQISTRYTHEQLGAMIGSKRVAVTRAFTKLQEAGALELKRRYIYVTDVKVLELSAGGGQGGHR